MYPHDERPMINPMEVLKAFPALSSNPVLYKSYYLYMKRKSEIGARYLSLEAFTDYFTQDQFSLMDYEELQTRLLLSYPTSDYFLFLTCTFANYECLSVI